MLIWRSWRGVWEGRAFSIKDSHVVGRNAQRQQGQTGRVYTLGETSFFSDSNGTRCTKNCKKKSCKRCSLCAHGWFRHIHIHTNHSISGHFSNPVMHRFPRWQSLPASPCFHTKTIAQTWRWFAASKELIRQNLVEMKLEDCISLPLRCYCAIA